MNKITLTPGIELAQIEGISSITVVGESIELRFSDGVCASVGRWELDWSKFAIFFPASDPQSVIAGSFTRAMTGEEVVQRINEMAVAAASKC